MGAFEDYIASLKSKGDNTEAHDTLYSELTNAHTSDLSIREAAIAEKDKELQAKQDALAAKEAELNAQKARNWDLIRSQPAPGDDAPNLATDHTGKPVGIDDLFERR